MLGFGHSYCADMTDFKDWKQIWEWLGMIITSLFPFSSSRIFFLVLPNNSYILFEVPTNLALRTVRPSLFFPTIMLGWGIVEP